MSYARRYPGGFKDYPDTSTPVDSQYLNGVEDALVAGGAGGGADANYVHNQVALSAVWTVVHNLGKFPSVSVVDTGNNELLPTIAYIDANTLTVTFAAATSGKVYVN